MFDVSLFPGPSAFLLALLPARTTMMAQDRQLFQSSGLCHAGDMIQRELMRGPQGSSNRLLAQSQPPAPPCTNFTTQAEARVSPGLESVTGGSRLELAGDGLAVSSQLRLSEL